MTFIIVCARPGIEKRPVVISIVHSILPSQTIVLFLSDGSSSENFIALQSTIQLFCTVSAAAMIKPPFPISSSSTYEQFLKNKTPSTVIWGMRWGRFFFSLWRVLCNYVSYRCTIKKYRRHKIIQLQGTGNFSEAWGKHMYFHPSCMRFPGIAGVICHLVGRFDVPGFICREVLLLCIRKKWNTRIKAGLLPS